MSVQPPIKNVVELEARLSEPTTGVIDTMARMTGDLIFLGAGGKMGPSLVRMARRACVDGGVRRRIIAVSRFTEARLVEELQRDGIDVIRCDLLDENQLDALPDAPNVLLMTGVKFGTSGQPSLTWASNVFLPGLICRKFRRSKIVAFSTGNVYPLSPIAWGGSNEVDPMAPLGEYAQTAVGRERLLDYSSRKLGIAMALLRLNYAVEMRYGVLVDIARRVQAGEPIDVSMGAFNVIWQGDANAMALQAFDQVGQPPTILNLAGPELVSVRRLAEQFGRLFGVAVHCTGQEATDALLSNGQRAHQLFGYPRVGLRQMIEWVADWVREGGVSLGKPTHFEVRDGTF